MTDLPPGQSSSRIQAIKGSPVRDTLVVLFWMAVMAVGGAFFLIKFLG